MKYIITNHSRQRRKNHEVKEYYFLNKWLKYFDTYFNFADILEDSRIYKIYYKGNVAIIKYENKKIILITFRGFKIPMKHFDIDKLKIKQDDRQDTIHKIYRINRSSQKVQCGYILSDYKNNYKYILQLKRNLIKKYKMPNFSDKIYFNNFEEIKDFIHLNNDDKLYYLNDFDLTPLN